MNELTALLVILALIALYMVRVWIVSGIRFRAIDMIHEKRIDAIAMGIDPEKAASYGLMRRPGLDAMCFDLRRWTFKSFYPVLVSDDAEWLRRADEARKEGFASPEAVDGLMGRWVSDKEYWEHQTPVSAAPHEPTEAA